MATGEAINRSYIDLPADVSNEILQKVQDGSKIMGLARQIALPGRGAAINVITSDPVAGWVGETEKKPVSNAEVGTKIMRAYKLAVIETFSNEFRRDASALYDALIARLPKAFGEKFDNTVFYGTAPGSDFDTLSGVTAHDIATNAYAGLVAAFGDVSTHGGIANGIILSPQAQGVLLGATDGDQRPLFINSVAEGAIPMVLGQRTEVTKAAYKSGTPDIVGFMGDWTQALYGIVEGVKIDFSADATLDLGSSKTINLFQQNMFAVRAEIEIGFRADTSVFASLSA